MTLEELALQGKHSTYDSLAASVSGKLINLRKDHVRQSLINFEDTEHRLEFVAKIHGISFVNDSRSTNVNSTWYALESMDDKVVWIAGGAHSHSDFSKLDPLVRSKVKAIICMGANNSHMIKTFGSMVPAIYDTHSTEQAVYTAYSIGRDGDTVLLSPACQGSDLFESYEDRGNQFKNAVRKL